MKYLNLASGASDLNSPKVAVTAAINALKSGNTFYGYDEGNANLREAISNRYIKDYQAKLPTENILITAGTKQALFNLFSVLLKPEDEVILVSPGWFGFEKLLQEIGAKPVYLTTDISDNYALSIEKLDTLLNEKTRLFIYSNPNNPTGHVYSEAEIKIVLNCLKNYPEIKILSDEIYDLILFDNVKITSLAQFKEVADCAIIVNGFSKNFAMSGWRIGYLIAPPYVYEKCLEFQHNTISGTNPFIQDGALAAIENRHKIMAGIIPVLEKKRQLITTWLHKFPEIKFKNPQGTYYIFADLREILKRAFFQKNGIVSTQKLVEFLKTEANLEMVAGERCNAPGFLRITFAVPEDDLSEALQRLEKLFKS